jgi:CubicO group peptidase (beta-lactamase class C family)
MRASVLLLVASLVLAAPSGIDTERLQRIPARMKEFIDRGAVSGAVVLVAHKGEVVLHEAVGLANREAKRPMQKDSIAQIMSMTKPVTGIAVMMLVEEGRLSLLDPVEKHLPEFKGQMLVDHIEPDGRVVLRKPARPINVRDLMTHTSGMISNPRAPIADLYQKMNLTLGEAVTTWAKEPLLFEPGTKWQYSNPGIGTLGRLVEVLSGQSFEQFVTSRLLAPLGMTDTFFYAPAEKKERIALIYKPGASGLERGGPTLLGGDPALYRPSAKFSAPEFGLYSTAPDLAKIYQMMLNNGTLNGRRYLSPAAVDVMTRVHTGDIRAGHMAGTGFGLTWEVVNQPTGLLTLRSEGTFFHGGAYGTFGWIDRKKNLVGVLILQHSGSANAEVQAAFMQMASAAVVE